MRTLPLLALAVLLAAPALAQTAFTYHGTLAVEGAPGDGAFDLSFALYDADREGNEVARAVEHRSVTVRDGAFAVALDFGAVFGGQRVWIETSVRPAGEGDYVRLEPRAEVTAVPSALALAEGGLTGAMIGADAIQGGSNVSVARDGDGNVVISSTGGGGGGSFALPYAGSASSTAAALNVSNGGTGAGARFTAAQGVGVSVTSGTDGVYVGSAGTPAGVLASPLANGVEVRGAEGHGLYVGAVLEDGVYVNTAEGHGVVVETATGDGLRVTSAGGRGLYVDASVGRGLQIDEAGNDGIAVLHAGDDGLFINRAGSPSHTVNFSTAPNGVEVVGAEGHGLFVGRADLDGVRVNSAGGYAGHFGGDVRVTEDLELAGGLVCTGCVGAGDVASGALTGAAVQDGTLAGADVQNASLTGADVASETLTGSHILNGTITRADIADETITGQEILDGSVTAADLAPSVLSGGAGGRGEGGDHNPAVQLQRNTDTVVRTLTVNAPSAGLVLVWANLALLGTDGDDESKNHPRIACALTTGFSTQGEGAMQVDLERQLADSNDPIFPDGVSIIDIRESIAMTRAYPVSTGQPFVTRLVCREENDDAIVTASHMTALFVPNTY